MPETKKNIPFLILLTVGFLLVSFILMYSENSQKKLIDTLVFSHEGGLYNQEFFLHIRTENENTKIYYTLDGTEPTTKSYLYKTPIEIKNRKNDMDKYTGILDIAEGYTPPTNPVFKGTVVRSRSFKKSKPASEIVTHTYFVDPNIQTRYTLPILSLVSDPINLFDYKLGIYVKGQEYKKLYDENLPFWDQKGNFSQSGRKWERDVHVEFFNQNGNLAFRQNAGFRIHGGATRPYPQKSLRIYARKEYGKESIDYPVFDGKKIFEDNHVAERFKTLILRNSGNDWYHTLFRDAMMQSLLEHTSLDIQAYRPVLVFINGEYWGIHNLREGFDKHYFNYYYGIDEDKIAILENNGVLYEGISEDEKFYQDMIDYISRNPMEDSIHYEYINTLIDIDNYINYHVAQIFFNNTDWPGNNIRFWRVRKDAYDPDAPYGHDGRWRWLLFDTDFGFGLYEHNGGYNENNLVYATSTNGPPWPNPDWSTFLFRSLLKNENFKNHFINTFADHLNTSFNSDRVVKRVLDMKSVLEPEIGEHKERWPMGGDWNSRVDIMVEFAKKRPEIQRNHIISFFNLSGYSKIRLDVSDVNQGYVKINTIDIKNTTPGVFDVAYPWIGNYFNDVPVSITAIPYEGHKFLRWEGDYQSPDKTISLILKDDIKLKAVFQ